MTRPPRFAERRRASGDAAQKPRRTGTVREYPDQVPPDELVLMGVVLGPHGVRGELRVKPFTAEPEGVCSHGPLYGDDGKRLLTPLRARAVKDGVVLETQEIRDRTAAEAIGKARVHVPRSALPPAEEEEFYHVDLIGCVVETTAGDMLGKVIGVQNFGAGDVLQIDGPSGGLYLEFTRAAVPIVDLNGKRLVAEPPLAEDDDEPAS